MMIIGVPECKSCTGLDNCNKYCIKRAGKNLADFMVGIETVETEIGEMRKPSKPGDSTLTVIGHQIDGESPTYILQELSGNTKINLAGKFNKFMEKNATSVLKAYTDTLDQEIYKDRIAEVTDLIKKLNSNKAFAVPFKLRTDVSAIIKDAQGRDKKVSGTIGQLLWKTNKETGRVEGKVLVRYYHPMRGSKSTWIPFNDYGKLLTLTDLERTLKASEVQPEFIQMTDVGFIRPIVISDRNIVIAVDCKHKYLISGDTTVIVGSWGEKGMVDHSNVELINKSKAHKKLESIIKYIENHRRFIAPLGLIGENKIQL